MKDLVLSFQPRTDLHSSSDASANFFFVEIKHFRSNGSEDDTGLAKQLMAKGTLWRYVQCCS